MLKWVLPIVLALSPAPAFALACSPEGNAKKLLKEKYQEQPIARGVSKDESITAEVYASKDGETWTWVVTRNDGVTCFVAAGKGWHNLIGRGDT